MPCSSPVTRERETHESISALTSTARPSLPPLPEPPLRAPVGEKQVASTLAQEEASQSRNLAILQSRNPTTGRPLPHPPGGCSASSVLVRDRLERRSLPRQQRTLYALFLKVSSVLGAGGGLPCVVA